MKKAILLILCVYLFQSNAIKQYIPDSEANHNTHTNELNNLYQQFISLEKKYNDKILKSYGINPQELKTQCDIYTDYNEKKECRMHYIMNKTNLSEQEYHDKFIHPLQQISDSKETTLNNVKNTYDDLKEKIDKIENLINVLNQDD